MKAWMLSPIALAVVSVNSYALDSVGIGMGSGFTLSPSIEANVENNDNIYSQSEDEASSTISRLIPAVALEGDFGKFKFNSSYQAEQGIYSKDSNDDYLDQSIKANGQYELTARHQFEMGASFDSAHDNRGSGTAEGADALLIEDPDQYDETTAELNYVFGSASAVVNIDLFADNYQKRYSNNEEFGTEDRDHDKLTYGTRLVAKASPATQLVFEAKQSVITYAENTDTAKAREGGLQSLLMGMRWDITGKTSGEVKIGRAVRSFDEDGIDSNSRFKWEANIEWKPLTYSSVNITSSQSNNETNGAGTYIAGTYTAVSWDHEFTSLFSAGINGSKSDDVYVDDAAGRKDETVSYGLNATYSAMPWMDVTAKYKQSNKNSNIEDLDNDNQIVSLGVTLAL